MNLCGHIQEAGARDYLNLHSRTAKITLSGFALKKINKIIYKVLFCIQDYPISNTSSN